MFQRPTKVKSSRNSPNFFKQALAELIDRGEKNPEIAMRILQTSAMKFKDWDLTRLACAHNDIAMSILKNPELVSKISAPYFVKIAEKHEEAAMFILKTPCLVATLKNWDLQRIACAHINAAMFILETETIARKLDGPYLTDIAASHSRSAIYILQTPSLTNKLRQDLDFERIYNAHGDKLEKYSANNHIKKLR